MAKITIIQDYEACIGCGMCANVCNNWEMRSDSKAHPKKIKLAELGCNQDAADACPVQCITFKK